MKKVFQIIWISLMFTLVVSLLNAVWMDDHPGVLDQPDGTTIEVFLSGDEYHNWAHDAEHYTIIQDETTGFWCWAIAENGGLISSGHPIHLHAPAEINITPNQNISDERYAEKRAAKEAYHSTRNSRAPTVGVIQNITIFIRFSNQNEFDTPLTLYDTFLNPTAPGVNSLYRYYWDASYNQLEVYSTFYPTPNGTSIVSYQDQYPRNYYMPYNETSNPEGYTGANEYSRRVTLLRNALEYAEQFIPSTLIIDGDGDGVIDNINFIVRGNSGAWADLLWPHMSNLYNANILVHGVRAGTYNFNMEDRASSSGVGVFAHEFGHSLGVPDFYRYNYNGTPVGGWDLMASDRNPPQSFSSSNKAKYLNWIPPLRTITANGTYTLVPNTVDGAECSYRINSPNSTTEYFVIEYRSRSTGLTDSNLSGEGLLVYRVNSLRNGNAQGPPDEIYYYRAGGTPNSDGTISNAAYSLESNRTAINDYTNPSSFLGNGNPGGLNIYNISALGETMTFTVNITGPDPSHFSESFESQTFTNFDWQNNSASPWSIVSDPTAPHGSYVATSGQIDAGQTSRLEIQLHHDNGYIQFHLKTSSAPDSGYLKFYMDGAELGSWSGNTIWTSFAMPVVAGPHHYAWVYQRTTAASGGENKVWIDRIGFPDYTGYILYPPQNLSANAVERVVTVNWQAPYVTVAPNPPTVLGYNLYVGNTLVNTTLINNTTYTINNAGGGNMRFTTKAIYEAGESDFSNDETINIPLAPATILAAYSHGRGVRIDWDYEYISYNLATFRIYKNGTLMTISGLSGSSRTYLDTAVTEGENYSYFIRAAYTNPIGSSSPSDTLYVNFVNEVDTEVDIVHTKLQGNYPNPFNPETTISYSVNDPSVVKIEIYNIKGQKVKTLVNELKQRGMHSVVWNGNDEDNRSVSSGIYFYKLHSGHITDVQKMVLMK